MRSTLEIAAVHNVVDLALCAEARRTLHRVLDARGLGFFVKPGRARAAFNHQRAAWRSSSSSAS